MHVVAIDPQQRLAVVAPHDLVGRPQLVEQGERFAHAYRSASNAAIGRNIEGVARQCSSVGMDVTWRVPMSHRSAQVTRRRLLQTTGAAAVATGLINAPAQLRAQASAVKLGVLHPVSGALSYSGQQGRLGAMIAIDEINAAGGIKALGGAKIEAVLGDAQSTPEGGNAEVEKMNSAGVAAIVGGYASSICLTASQTAARYDLPYVVDVGVADNIVTRGLKNTFRFGPGF